MDIDFAIRHLQSK